MLRSRFSKLIAHQKIHGIVSCLSAFPIEVDVANITMWASFSALVLHPVMMVVMMMMMMEMMMAMILLQPAPAAAAAAS
ncbi:unnamed protein product [Nippostrongylus brasiliensis]|uniref:Secreted protein n=1 Tax=Nippostrongylus brasiliensis TaxID=27835 RepID=A0A0N4Y628_NIPBR|nr:unnamed protein product [Nippostrongylus brasiliensis]